MGSFRSFQGNKYILVIVDYVSKWVEALASPTNDSRVVTILSKKIIFPCFGVPTSSLVTMVHFIKKKLEALLKKYGVRHKHGLGYHPQTSGQVEIPN